MQKCSTSGDAAWAALRIAQWHLLLETDEHLGVRSSGTTWGPGRGKGWKLQGAWHDTMMLRMRLMLNLLPVATCRRCPVGQSACKPASWTGGRGVVKYEVSCDWSFQPPQYLAIWQEGLQLAEASWIVICINLVISCQIFLRTSWRDQESPESTLNQPHFFKVLKVRTSRLCSNINPTARLLRGRMYLGLHVLHLRWGRTTGYWKAWLSMEYLHLPHQYTEHRGFHGFIPWFHVISCNNTAQT